MANIFDVVLDILKLERKEPTAEQLRAAVVEIITDVQEGDLRILSRVMLGLARLEVIELKIDRILAVIDPSVAVKFTILVSDLDGGNSIEVGTETMNVIVGGKKLLSVIPRDQFGNVATIDGKPKWDKSGDVFGDLTVSEDALSAVVEIGTVAGLTGQVTITGDSDLSSDVETLFHSTADFSSISGAAVSFDMNVQDAPAAAPAVV